MPRQPDLFATYEEPAQIALTYRPTYNMLTPGGALHVRVVGRRGTILLETSIDHPGRSQDLLGTHVSELMTVMVSSDSVETVKRLTGLHRDVARKYSEICTPPGHDRF